MTVVIDRVFTAIADPTRRQIIEWLDDGSVATATEVAGRLPMTRQAVAKHLKELESAGLVSSRHMGRETRYVSNPTSLRTVSNWISQREAAWDNRLSRLSMYATDGSRLSGQGSDSD
jgi:DNA-binding transcriptional ArsR family regulator